MIEFLTAVIDELTGRENRLYLILVVGTAALSAVLWLTT